MASSLSVRFWGVRGSTPTPVAENLGYGGNTSCIEIESGGGTRLIIDAGTGIRGLGRTLAKSPGEINLLLTHFHWDHIQGLPFFAPLFQPQTRLRIHSFPEPREIHARLGRQMSDPFFTLDFERASAVCEFIQVSRQPFCLGDLEIVPFPLHHPQVAFGYRISSSSASVVIATDVEHGDPELDQLLRQMAQRADLLVYDAQYTQEEYSVRQGWGHSTADAAVQVAADAAVKQLVLFHHDPNRSDNEMDEIVAGTCPRFPSTIAAREGQVLHL